MQRGHWIVAALVGVLVAVVVAALPLTWPALAIGAGAIVSIVVHGLGTSPRTRYAVLGTAYCLGLAAVVGLALSSVDIETALGASAWRSLATLGTASALLVGVGLLVRRTVGSVASALAPGTGGRSVPGVDPEHPSRTVRNLSSAVRWAPRVLGTLRTLIAVGGTIARFAGVVLLGVVATLGVGVVTFALDGLGVSAPIPWLGGSEVDAVLLGFVAAVLVGFYVLAALRVLVSAAATGVGVGRDAGSRIAAARREGRDPPAIEERRPDDTGSDSGTE